ncbi:AzlD domain-containing protein [Phyllobacterium zundukense]|uniref:Branched-chain amino acid transport n=1 Tax=Phyllobacterium zundukense TaxID=1867719 RepID=A0A2N9W1K3_9HYPH|nr:AzlD domain-containing protein [Phyllobacterium zundukense]ATU91606.1 branched-chain amino acid transport [Phyllobacterium zundukense]PIO45621.1 branched-chain amino acid transport [Phyllobacterium zundukense]
MTWDSVSAWWWPYLFILLAGWLPTDIWRWVGVLIGGRVREDSEALIIVRAVATALVAGVIAQLILYPSGSLAESSVVLRVGAAAAGFAAYLCLGRRVIVGVLVAEVVLVSGLSLNF